MKKTFKVIPFANYIICGVVIALLAACFGRGGTISSRETPATDFSYKMASNGEGIIITKYTGNGGAVVIPAKIEGIPVVSISDGAFSTTGTSYGNLIRDIFGGGGNTESVEIKVTSVVIPESVSYIGMEAFRDCKNLKSITIKGTGVVISQYAFSGSEELTTFQFPNSENALIPDPGYSALSLFGTGGTLGAILSGEAFFGNSGKKLPLATRERLKNLGFSD